MLSYQIIWPCHDRNMAKSKKPVHSRNMAKNKETRPYANMAKNDTQTVSRLYSKEQRECVLEKILVKL